MGHSMMGAAAAATAAARPTMVGVISVWIYPSFFCGNCTILLDFKKPKARHRLTSSWALWTRSCLSRRLAWILTWAAFRSEGDWLKTGGSDTLTHQFFFVPVASPKSPSPSVRNRVISSRLGLGKERMRRIQCRTVRWGSENFWKIRYTVQLRFYLMPSVRAVRYFLHFPEYKIYLSCFFCYVLNSVSDFLRSAFLGRGEIETSPDFSLRHGGRRGGRTEGGELDICFFSLPHPRSSPS